MTRLPLTSCLILTSALSVLACDSDVVVGRVPGASSAGGAVATASGGVAGGGTAGAAHGTIVPWTATHEVGDLQEWTDDGAGWSFTDRGALAVSTEYAHGGSRSVEMRVDPQGADQAQATLGRDASLETGRYGAWILFPSADEAQDAVLMKLATWGETSQAREERFDLNVRLADDGSLQLFLYEHGPGEISELSPALPYGEWVHLEMRYRATSDPVGRVVVLQDGDVVFDTGLRATAANDRVSWSVGLWVGENRTEPMRIFVDDATIRDDVL